MLRFDGGLDLDFVYKQMDRIKFLTNINELNALKDKLESYSSIIQRGIYLIKGRVKELRGIPKKGAIVILQDKIDGCEVIRVFLAVLYIDYVNVAPTDRVVVLYDEEEVREYRLAKVYASYLAMKHGFKESSIIEVSLDMLRVKKNRSNLTNNLYMKILNTEEPKEI